MSVRVDTASLIAGAVVVGDRGLGVTGAIIRTNTAIGTNGSGYLYNDWDDSDDDNKEFRGEIITAIPAGFFANEDGSFSLTGAADGTYTFDYRLYVDGIDLGVATVSMTIGNQTLTPSLFSNINTFYSHVLNQPTSSYVPSSDLIANGWTAVGAATMSEAMTDVDLADYAQSPNLSDSATFMWNTTLAAGTYDIPVVFDRTGTNGQLRLVLLNSGGSAVGTTSWQAASATPATTTFNITISGASDRFRIEVQP